MTDKKETESKTLFSKVVNKLASNGRVVGSMTIEVKTFDGHKFIQLTQEKASYGNQLGKRGFVTFNPAEKEIKEAIFEAYKH